MLHLRFAAEADIPLILQLIRGLAIYEKMEEEMVATPELLRHWLFQEKKAEVLIGEEAGETIGFALFFHNFSTFVGKAGLYLEDLYILEAYRGKGYGRAFFKKLGAIALERGCGRMEWCCLDWNAPGIAFYKSMGARPMDAWTTYRMTGDQLRELVGDEA